MPEKKKKKKKKKGPYIQNTQPYLCQIWSFATSNVILIIYGKEGRLSPLKNVDAPFDHIKDH
jgi:hypothetical protein